MVNYYTDRGYPEFDDPVQGTACQNCSLIAGLSALAWVNPRILKGNILNNQNQIKFYNWVGQSPTVGIFSKYLGPCSRILSFV